ncbi:hypothetical protein [Botrimarina sp.]|uniref:hypothetical protein n=1 Tax=Botrimarina sp. TaxID=2795802 RepID=UPI0032EE76D2
MWQWTEPIVKFVQDRIGQTWIWFDTLSRGEWLIVLASCCAMGFLLLKSRGHRGPC